MCVCRVAGGVVCGCCVSVPGWRVEGDDVYVVIVGVYWVGCMMWGGVCCADFGVYGCRVGCVL